MPWEFIEVTEHDDGITSLSLDRPDRHNAQSPELLEEFEDALESIEDDDRTRVLVIDGNGPSFSTGHELNAEMLDERANEWRSESFLEFERTYYYEPCLLLRDLELPTIAQVHGHCTAAGMMVAAMCDLIVAAEDAKFSNPVNRMAAAGVELLFEPWDMGVRKAKEFLWTGDTISGEEAERLGFVNRAVPEDQLEGETMKLATKVGRMPPHGVKLSKRSFRFMADQMGQRASLDYHFLQHELQHLSREYSDWRIDAQDRMEEEGLGGWIRHRDDPFEIDDE